MDDPASDDKRLPEISGVYISIVTALAYAMAFAFEAGNAGAFGIPFEMIDLQLMPAIFGMLVALSILWWSLQQFDGLIPALRRKPADHPVLWALKPSIALLVSGAAIWMLVRPVSWNVILVGLVAAISYSAIDFAMALLQFNQKGYVEKLRNHQAMTKPSYGPVMTTLLDHGLFLKTQLAILLVVASAAAGYGRGHRQLDFFVTNLEPETIVLRIYGNRAIAAEFVRAEKRVKPVYRFVRLDEPGLTLPARPSWPYYLYRRAVKGELDASGVAFRVARSHPGRKQLQRWRRKHLHALSQQRDRPCNAYSRRDIRC